MAVAEQALTEQQISEARSTILYFIRERLYGDAALVSYRLGEMTGEVVHYINAAALFFIAEDFEKSREFCEQIKAAFLAAGKAIHPKVLRIDALLLIAEGKLEEASQACQQLATTSTSHSWMLNLEHIQLQDLAAALIDHEQHTLEIISAETEGVDYFFRIKLSVRCTECGLIFSDEFQRSIFQMGTRVCPDCMHLYSIGPAQMADALRRTTTRASRDQALGLDMLVHHWSNNWWKQRTLPASLRLSESATLPQMVSFRLHMILGALYSKVLNRLNSAKDRG